MAMREEKLTLATAMSNLATRAPSLPRQIGRESFMAGSLNRPGSRHGSSLQLNKEAPVKLQVKMSIKIGLDEFF